MKQLLLFLISSSCLFCESCSKQTSTDTGGAPTAPRWVELTVGVDSLPSSGRMGSMRFHFIVIGEGNRMPVTAGGDTLNYIRIALYPDPGRQPSTIMQGDTGWVGRVQYLDTLSLRTEFTPGQTTFIYTEWVGTVLHEYDWAVRFINEFYHQRNDSSLVGMGGYGLPYATFYVNTQTGDTLTKIHAVR